jgi:hypothetical protein
VKNNQHFCGFTDKLFIFAHDITGIMLPFIIIITCGGVMRLQADDSCKYRERIITLYININILKL